MPKAAPTPTAAKSRAGKVIKKTAAHPAAPTTPATKSGAKTLAHPAVAKPAKTKKTKLVRDSFTIPKAEYSVLDELKLRAVKLAHPVKKSELLRAGIKALTGLSDKAFLEALEAVPTIKTGRPKKD